MRTSALLLIAALLLPVDTRAEVRSYIERQSFQKEVEQQVAAGNYRALEQRAEALLRQKSRSASGVWLQALFYSATATGFEASITDDASWKSVDEALTALTRERPLSQSAVLIHAIAIQQNAWRLRGKGFNNTTTANGRAAFRTEILRARALLDSHKTRLSKNPEWFAQRINLATYSSEGSTRVEQLFKEGVESEPLYHQTYFHALFHYSPRWGGSVDEMVAFMNRAARRPTAGEGLSMYARLAWYADQQREYALQEHAAIDWETMKKSFGDVLRSFPDDWNAQQFLVMACTRPDMSTAKDVARFIKEAPSEALHGKNMEVYRLCLERARGKGEPFMLKGSNGQMKYIE